MRNLLVLFLLTSSTITWGQVGIGTTSPHKSSILEVKSNDRGMIIPRLDSLSINLIDNPVEGLILYNTTDSTIQYHDGIQWKDFQRDTVYIEVPVSIPVMSNQERINIQNPYPGQKVYVYDFWWDGQTHHGREFVYDGDHWGYVRLKIVNP